MLRGWLQRPSPKFVNIRTRLWSERTDLNLAWDDVTGWRHWWSFIGRYDMVASMQSSFDMERFAQYEYLSETGGYHVRQWVCAEGIVHQKKIGYANEQDAIAEADKMAAIVHDFELNDALYVSLDLTEFEGVALAGRRVIAERFKENDHEWFVAAHGANAFTRILGRLLGALRPAMNVRFYKSETDALRFLTDSIRARARGGAVSTAPPLNPKMPNGLELRYPSGRKGITLDGEAFSVFSPTHWTYVGEGQSLTVTYSLLSPDVIFIKLRGALETEAQLDAARQVAESVYEEIGAERLYVIRDSRDVRRVSLAGRRAYIEYAKRSGGRERLVIHIGSNLSRLLLRSIRALAPQTFGKWEGARDLPEALARIREHRGASVPAREENEFEAPGNSRPSGGQDVQVVTRLVERLIKMGWDVNHDPEDLALPKDHPYQELVLTLNLLQRDLQESFAVQQVQLEALKESRGRLRQAQELAHLASWEWEPETGRMHWSRETYQMFGYEPLEVEPSYDLFLEHLHPDTRDCALASITDALESGETFENQVHILERGGALRMCRLRGRSEFNSRTKRRLVRATFLDATELIQAKLSAEQANSVLEESHAGLKEHLAALSHDVRTPLTSLKLGLSRLVDAQLPDRLGPALRAEVEHLDTLFANMLSLTRLKVVGPEAMAATPCTLRELMGRIRIRLSVLARDQGVEILFEEEGVGGAVLADELAMEQAVTNLVHNAIKFAQTSVSIDVNETEEHVQVLICDDGPGLEYAAQGPTRPLNSSLPFVVTEAGKGLGLGFAIANTIVTNHGGSIVVAQREAGGTQVTVFIPRDIAETRKTSLGAAS